jgi:excisionase family DNA binding protein
MRKTTEPADFGKLLALKDAAEKCGLSGWTLRRWALQGRIPHVKLANRVLIPEKAVEAMIANHFKPVRCPDEMRLA